MIRHRRRYAHNTLPANLYPDLHSDVAMPNDELLEVHKFRPAKLKRDATTQQYAFPSRSRRSHLVAFVQRVREGVQPSTLLQLSERLCARGLQERTAGTAAVAGAGVHSQRGLHRSGQLYD